MSPRGDSSTTARETSSETELDGLAFSTRHAYLMLGGVVLATLCSSSWPLALTALASFSGLLLQLRAAFDDTGFGAANWVTTARLLSLLFLAELLDARMPFLAAALAWSIFALDWLDGYLARRNQSETSFGALYDSEVDACFSMLLTWGVFQLDRAGAWVLIGGVLRYAYVLSLHLSGVREREAPRTRLGRYVFGLSIGGYTLSLWPFSGVAALVLCAAATALLCYSFSRSFLWTFAPRRKQA
jgi:phosphatidylglycerophosphate synthase